MGLVVSNGGWDERRKKEDVKLSSVELSKISTAAVDGDADLIKQEIY